MSDKKKTDYQNFRHYEMQSKFDIHQDIQPCSATKSEHIYSLFHIDELGDMPVRPYIPTILPGNIEPMICYNVHHPCNHPIKG